MSPENHLQDQGRLLVSCPDRPGIIAAISHFLFERGANIVHSDQHSTDPTGGTFFLRIVFQLPELARELPRLETEFATTARQFEMSARFTLAARRKRLAIFVSREEHCLLEILWQWHSGDLPIEPAMVIGNHPHLARFTEPWSIPYHHLPVTPETRSQVERQQLDLLRDQVDAVVLARYMQVLSREFVGAWRNRIINIHHSFLPAFAGAKPYHQAYERGVKLIGATAHYVTEELDAGPIIEQDVQRVDHRHSPEGLRRLGRQVERMVLARAVKWHVEDRVLVHGNKTVVFA